MLAFLKQKYTRLLSDTRFSEILTGSAWALSARVLATAIGLATSIIIARFYGAEMMGIVAVLNSFLMLATLFTLLGTGTSILRLIPEYMIRYSPTAAFRLYRKTQYFVAGVSLITSALLFFGSGVIADRVFSKPHLQFYFALAALFIFFQSLMDLNTQAIRGVRLIRVFAFMQVLPSLAKLVILIPITIFFFHPDNPVYAMFAAIAITALAGALIMDRAFKQKTSPQDVLHPMPMKEILSISLPMLMTAGMFFLLSQTSVIMLGIYRSEAEVGYYAAAVKLATLTSFVLQAVNSMAAPKFSELFHTGKMDELFYVAKKSTKLIFWTTSPILLVLIVLGSPILVLLYGSDFAAARWAMVILVTGQFIHGACGSTGIFMNMTGHQKALRNIIACAAAICVILNLLLAPAWGMPGAAVAATASILFWNFAVLIFLKRKFNKTTAYFPFFTRK